MLKLDEDVCVAEELAGLLLNGVDADDEVVMSRKVVVKPDVRKFDVVCSDTEADVAPLKEVATPEDELLAML